MIIFSRRILKLSVKHYSVSTNQPHRVIDLHSFTPELIRNFSIIAHIGMIAHIPQTLDHGKSTLADRLLELTNTISTGGNKQVMDTLKVERDRGITVKANSASMVYNYQGKEYLLNLIDTPGHVDFSYEVSRSLASCQGAILLVDACNGIQAQTVANFYLAFSQNLDIVPILNKVDLDTANPDSVIEQMAKTFEIGKEPLRISAKTGFNVDLVLPAIINGVAPPKVDRLKPFRALLFDSWYDQFRGVICMIACGNGILVMGDKLSSGHTGKTYEVLQCGIMSPNQIPTHSIYSGQVGFVVLGMKSVHEAKIGDTFYHPGSTDIELYPNFEPVRPVVFSGLYPVDSNDYSKLSEALDRLTCLLILLVTQVNDSSVTVIKESSSALGQGFRIGYLGRLHMDVFNQRLDEEYSSAVINTAPTVPYKVIGVDDQEVIIRNPSDFPEEKVVKCFLEPMILGTIILPSEYIGAIIELCSNHRGEQIECTYIDESRVLLKYKIPMAEILTDFYNLLKSKTSGYASFDYEESGYQQTDLVKVDFLLNSKAVDALSQIVPRATSLRIAKAGVHRLANVMERFVHLFAYTRGLIDIMIQASVSGKIIARESIKARRKDVTAKCYGGDVTRRMKLLDKQKEGKKRMAKVKSLSGGITLPQEAFMKIV